MHSVNDYQSIRTPEDEEYERDVEIVFENLVEYYADEISEQGMNWQQKASLMARARQIVNARRNRKMTITSYFGLKPCCDCGRTGNYIVNKNGYQFTVCADCVHNYSDEEEKE